MAGRPCLQAVLTCRPPRVPVVVAAPRKPVPLPLDPPGGCSQPVCPSASTEQLGRARRAAPSRAFLAQGSTGASGGGGGGIRHGRARPGPVRHFRPIFAALQAHKQAGGNARQAGERSWGSSWRGPGCRPVQGDDRVPGPPWGQAAGGHVRRQEQEPGIPGGRPGQAEAGGTGAVLRGPPWGLPSPGPGASWVGWRCRLRECGEDLRGPEQQDVATEQEPRGPVHLGGGATGREGALLSWLLALAVGDGDGDRRPRAAAELGRAAAGGLQEVNQGEGRGLERKRTQQAGRA